MSQLTELKIYKKLYEINSGIVHRMYLNARNRLEYRDSFEVDKKEEKDLQFIDSIANKKKWDYCGIASASTIELADFLEYLLDDKKPAQ